MGDDLGCPNGERADSKLKNLEPLGGVLGLEVGGVDGVERQHPVPRSGGRAGLLQRDGDEVGNGDAVLDFFERLQEIGPRHLLDGPLVWVVGGDLAAQRPGFQHLLGGDAHAHTPHHSGVFEDTEVLLCSINT